MRKANKKSVRKVKDQAPAMFLALVKTHRSKNWVTFGFNKRKDLDGFTKEAIAGGCEVATYFSM